MAERSATGASPDPAAFARAALAAGADALAAVSPDQVAALAAAWIDCLGRGGTLLLAGNGGSQADAQHLCGELVNRFRRDRRALPALALGTSAPILTAIANDTDYLEIFAREVEAHGRPGDLLVGFSTSGRSPNVVRALERARALGLATLAFTGRRGGPVADAAGLAFRAPSDDTPIVQQVHMAVGHILCDLVEQTLRPGS